MRLSKLVPKVLIPCILASSCKSVCCRWSTSLYFSASTCPTSPKPLATSHPLFSWATSICYPACGCVPSRGVARGEPSSAAPCKLPMWRCSIWAGVVLELSGLGVIVVVTIGAMAGTGMAAMLPLAKAGGETATVPLMAKEAGRLAALQLIN